MPTHRTGNNAYSIQQIGFGGTGAATNTTSFVDGVQRGPLPQPLADPRPQYATLGEQEQPAPVMTVELGTALDVSQPQPLGKVKQILPVVDSQVALAVGRSKSRALTNATTTDIAQPLAGRKARTLSAPTEQSSAVALGRRKASTLNVAAELQTADALGRRKHRQLGTSTATETALEITRAAPGVSLGLAAEIDVARTLNRAKQRQAGVAGDVSSSRPVALVKRRAIAAAQEASSPLAIGRRHGRTVGAAGDASTAANLAWTRSRTVGAAVETNTAPLITRFLPGGPRASMTLASLPTPAVVLVTAQDATTVVRTDPPAGDVSTRQEASLAASTGASAITLTTEP